MGLFGAVGPAAKIDPPYDYSRAARSLRVQLINRFESEQVFHLSSAAQRIVKRLANPIFSNFVFLASIQGANLLAPLITLPYLVRVIGFEKLGVLATAAATCAWLNILIDYGFNLTATRLVSTRRDDLAELSRVFSAVTAAKALLIIASALVLAIVLLAFPSLHAYSLAYFLSFTFVVAQALLPTWIFQGLEKMAPVAILNAAGKIIAAAFIIASVHNPADFVRVPLINTCVALVSAISAMWILHRRFGVRLDRPDRKKIGQMLKEGGAVFTATAAGNIYSQGPILILNVFTDAISVGKYSIAQKIATASISLFQSLSQAYFPQLSRLWLDSPERFSRLLKRYLLSTQLASAVLLGVLFILAPVIYRLLTSAQDDQGILAIRCWLLTAELIVFSVMLNPVLIAIGRDRDMARMYVLCGFSFLVYACVLTHFFLLKGMLASMILVETTIAAASTISVFRSLKLRRLALV